MAGTERDTAHLSKGEEAWEAKIEFDGHGRITASSPGPKGPTYAVDMSLDELFEDQAQVEKVTGVVHLNTPYGDEIGRYQRFEHRPSTESSDVHQPASSEDSEDSEDYGKILGKRGANYEDLTEYAAEDALKELDRVSATKDLGDMTEPRDIPDF